MPNWVQHGLTITGPEAERERFIAECFSKADDGMRFDFNRLIPEPKHSDDGDDVIYFDKPGSVRIPAWYEWCCANWGTKWNACRTTLTHERDAILLSFDTAWSPPVPIFNELARRFPKLKIEGSYVDIQYPFSGNLLCENGNVGWEDTSAEIIAAMDEFEREHEARAAKQ
jgi:hypothetical protein